MRGRVARQRPVSRNQNRRASAISTVISHVPSNLVGGCPRRVDHAGQGWVDLLVVTHEMGFARRAAQRVVFMADGEIVEDAPPDTFFTQPRSDRAKDFLGKILTH